MEFDIGGLKLKNKAVDISHLIGQISTGKAILFTGAGFSKGTTNVENGEPPCAKELSFEICRLGQFDADEDLRYSADYYLSHCDKESLIELLKQKYVLKDVSEIHTNICKPNWRRFYTTNYDKCIEIASSRNGKVIECIDVVYPAVEYYKRDGLCVHLNGSIDSLTQDSFENSFKLSTSSYISTDSFLKSDWFYYFKKDLERSSAIVFAGYSMYDVEIQKILFENQTLKEKIYFITSENPSPKSLFILSKFGNVIPIGVKGLSKLISDNAHMFNNPDNEHNLQALCLYELKSECEEIRDSNVEKLLMYGDIDDEHIDNGVCGKQRLPYLISRDYLENILEFTRNGKNTIIYGDLGNGKSILLRELKSYLSVNSIQVYDIVDWDGDYIGDIDLLSKSKNRVVVIADGYERYFDLIAHYSRILPKTINIIASARTAEHERLRSNLKNIGFKFNEICVDDLSEKESSAFIDIIDNVGMWGTKAGLSHDKKIDLLREANTLQISVSLLYLLDAPQIKKRITSILTDLIAKPIHKDTIFAIAVIEVLDLKATFSLISDVAGNDSIYTSLLHQEESFRHLFKSQGNQIVPKSRLYCLSLIRNHFPTTYVTNQLQKIAKHFNEYKRKDFEQDRIFKAMLRFSTVERLMPDANKKSNLKRYYEDLKISVPWLTHDPHFWLQYGMANITFQEYTRAQQFIDQAYALAKARDDYYTTNIDTQQARLYLLLAMKENDSAVIYNYFEKAHRLLSDLINDAYKFRQVQKYKDFYDACFTRLSKGNRVKFHHACIDMLSQMENAEARGEVFVGYATIDRARKNLMYIDSKIKHKSYIEVI